MREPAAATHTFLFTDIEGSTRLIQAHADQYPRLLAEHRRLVGDAVESIGGSIFGTEGDALFCVFDSPLAAITAGAGGQRALAGHDWPPGGEIRVRMGIHTGEAIATGGDYVGLTLHEVARLMSAGHGGQVLVSNITRQLVAASLPAELTLRDLGEHRLKDLSMPERLFQLVGDGLPAEFPPLRTLSARPNNLPVQLTSFVGRAELAQSQRALESTRLLTLSGPGGTGKTRLALQLAAEMSDEFPDGVYFVPLDSVADHTLVATSIGAGLGLTATAGTSPEQRVIDHLRGKRVLLVLDNFEQIVGAGPYVGQLLRELPELKVIVTSRILLRVYGETDYAVPPLGLPLADEHGPWTAEGAARSEAVRLFVERAVAAQPAFELTDANAGAMVEVARRLDGLPLAIELAAARVRIFSVETIADRLDQRLRLLTGGARDVPERQRTLRGAIDWSYDLLDEADRRLFGRFSIFAGGAYLAQAEPVCGTYDEIGTEILDGLASLTDKSLVRPAQTADRDPRFAMLGTIREYGHEKLAEAGDLDELSRRHADTFLALAEQAEPSLTGVDAAHWLDRLETDHDNLRAALEWSVESGKANVALRMLAALWRFWQIRGHLYDARRWADRVLTMPGTGSEPASVRARAFGAGGSISYWQGASIAAHHYYADALAAAQETGDRRAIALAYYNTSFAPMDYDPDDRAELLRAGQEPLREALRLYEELGDRGGIADANWALSVMQLANRNIEMASQHASRALELGRQLGDPFRTAWAAHILGGVLVYRHQLDEAGPVFHETLEIFSRSGDRGGILLGLLDVALLAAKRGDTDLYLRLGGAIEMIRQQSGIGASDINFFDLGIGDFFWRLPVKPPDAEGAAAWEAGSRLSIEEAVSLALPAVSPREAVAG